MKTEVVATNMLELNIHQQIQNEMQKKGDTFSINGGIPSYTVHSFVNLQFKWYVSYMNPGILSNAENRDKEMQNHPRLASAGST